MMLRLSTTDPGFEKKFKRLVDGRRESDEDVSSTVAHILGEVRALGDEALAEYTERFDKHVLATEDDWRIAPQACREAYDALDPALRDALELAAARIRAYHQNQLPADRDFTDEAGVRLGARWHPVDAAGLYVPGGRAAYPSSLLMNAIPAKVAGVQRIAVVTPTPKGQANPLVLAAAHIAGIDEIWRVGGAQAIAALAYGTNRIKRVDVVTGPGNDYVAEAKRQLFGVVGIDMVAGPSEILVIADNRNDPDWIAADLEHRGVVEQAARGGVRGERPQAVDECGLAAQRTAFATASSTPLTILASLLSKKAWATSRYSLIVVLTGMSGRATSS